MNHFLILVAAAADRLVLCRGCVICVVGAFVASWVRFLCRGCVICVVGASFVSWVRLLFGVAAASEAGGGVKISPSIKLLSVAQGRLFFLEVKAEFVSRLLYRCLSAFY